MEDLSHALMSERQWRSEIIKFMHELRKVTETDLTRRRGLACFLYAAAHRRA
jgi:hypothetical protein